MKKGWEMAGGDKRGKGGVGDGERQGKEDREKGKERIRGEERGWRVQYDGQQSF